ncbi:MAG: VanZ family protein [Methylophilaceae bacterium]
MPYLFWALIILTSILLLIEIPHQDGPPKHLDKVAHALIFLTLSYVGYTAFPKRSTIVYLALALYGILTELLQQVLTTTRGASIYDWYADIAGIFLCIIAISLFKKRLS